MFTGIIRHIGSIQKSTRGPDGSVMLEIAAPFSDKLHEGDSVSVNGVCLTVLSHTDITWNARLMQETIKKTTLELLQASEQINLELPTKAGYGLHGHIVQGHVDSTCTIIDITAHGNDRIITFQPPKEFLSRITPKGSIALNGVSLTVVDVTDDSFTVSLMPYTLEHTVFNTKKVGDLVNMETDHSKNASWLFGTVIRGERRGTTLGFPTANIQLDANSSLPPEGIYACRAMIEGDPTMYAGALHSGPRPTFPDATPSVELHLIHFSARDLYGQKIRFALIKKIRDIAKFNSTETLITAITEDISKATSILMYD